MSRPCANDHPPSPDTCRLCWLVAHVPEYAALWPEGGPNPPAPAPARPPVPRGLPCVYLGEVISHADPYTGVVCRCPALWARACAVHGRCNINTCKTCDDYCGC